MPIWLTATLLGLLPLVYVLLLWRFARARRRIFLGRLVALLVGGGIAGLATCWIQYRVLGWANLEVSPKTGASMALFVTFLFVAPLHEATKVAVLWPLYRSRRLAGPRLGMVFGFSVGAGFATMETIWLIVGGYWSGPDLARVAFGQPVQLFGPALWGFYLGRDRHPRGRWFSLAWLVAVLVHGLYSHLVYARGPAFLVAAAAMALAMAGLAALVLKDLSEQPVPSGRGSLLSALPEAPSLRAMRRALRRTERPVMFRWIGIGTFVTIGVMLVSAGSAVWLGHEFGIDFAEVNDPDRAATAPLVLLGLSVLVSFPFAGFLVAKASSATSVLEPAYGAGIAIVVVILMVSLANPIGVLFALALAPIAFALACGGAWFGMAR